MSKTRDWIPAGKPGVLARALSWSDIMPEEVEIGGVTKKKHEWWRIPLEEVSAFMDDYVAARDAYQVATNEETRTKVTVKACNNAIKKLKATMRWLRRVYFHIPPLTEEDFLSLGLKAPSDSRNPTGEPDAQVRVVVYLTRGFHELGINFEYISGDPDNPSNKEFRLYYLVAAPGQNEPKDVSALTESVGMRKKKNNILPLTPGDSGKKIFLAARVENAAKKGPWGIMTSAIIP